jgi:tetratricopeptide (TPR) repeat protein
LQKLQLAQHTIDRAIALDPLTPANYDTKAGMLAWEGDWAGAETLYRRALELNPDFRAAAAGLGNASAVQGNFAEAIQYAELAVALDPRAVSMRDYLVQLYFLLNDKDSARSVSIPPTLFGQIAALWNKGEFGHLADMIYSQEPELLAQFSSEHLSQIVLAQALADQDYARALNLLATTYRMGNSLPPTAFGWQLYAYANLVQLLAASGDGVAASHLQEQINARMLAIESQFPRHARLYDQVRATLLAHAGHIEEACAAFNRSLTPAPGPRWRVILSNSAFDKMRAAPCLKDLLTRLETHASAERAKLDAMRRAGQVPDRKKLLVEHAVDAPT